VGWDRESWFGELGCLVLGRGEVLVIPLIFGFGFEFFLAMFCSGLLVGYGQGVFGTGTMESQRCFHYDMYIQGIQVMLLP
jgi:hypothetical protein